MQSCLIFRRLENDSAGLHCTKHMVVPFYGRRAEEEESCLTGPSHTQGDHFCCPSETQERIVTGCLESSLTGSNHASTKSSIFRKEPKVQVNTLYAR